MPRVMKKKAFDLEAEDLPAFLNRYAQLKQASKDFAEKFAEQKVLLKAYVQKHGTKDEAGSLWIKIDGAPDVKLERRSTKSLNGERAEAWLKEHKMLKSCQIVEVSLDEDAVAAAAFTGKIPPAVFKSFYDDDVSWAMVKP